MTLTSTSASASPRLETARTFIAGFANLSADALVSTRTADCTHLFAPASLGALTTPKDNATFAAHLAGLRDVLAGFPVTAKEMIESDIQNTVTVWATSNALFRDELKDDGLPADEWAYRGEYIFLLTMDDTGRRIRRIVEFLDSKATDRLLLLMARARENRRKLLAANSASLHSS
ncbi:hypothetical protein A1O3_06139 [Capronia epimyces CBS 606.96]|uniref:SnoaL-like domain-containing protein n=1 Tax=Capronia epimyces CBS 606.96 TaxID=1182542 RepID=W9XZC2_9EURO|nr:uncharacterized protein A1O3_06139 [Capronia epimyces CBS 606.96]EXJ82326.1 hypothetical protein A1O3_06139 [Capronia epimyces CBS 606.96]